MTPSCSSPSSPPSSMKIFLAGKLFLVPSLTGWLQTSSASINSAKTEFLLLGLKPQLNKIHNSALTLSNGASVSPSPSCSSQSWYHLWCPSHLFRSDFFTCSLVLLPHLGSPMHSPCPSFQYSSHHCLITCTLKALQLTVLWSSKNQLTRLQHIQNSLSRSVVAAPRSPDPDQILKSLHWLKLTGAHRIQNYFYNL